MYGERDGARSFAAASAVAALGLPAAQTRSPAAVPGLVYTPGYGNSIVARYDPFTLERTGPRVRLGGNASSWSWSPQRRYLAVASYPQRLTVFEVPTMRVVSRTRLAPSGGVTHAVTWTRRDRVAAVVDTPEGVVVATVDPLASRLVRRILIRRPFGYQFERLPNGLVFLLGAHGRVEPVRLASVEPDGRLRMVTIGPVPAGFVVRGEHRRPGLAVDPGRAKAFVVGGDRVVPVDLRTLIVAGGGRLRTLEKLSLGSTRDAQWLGDGLIAVSGTDWDVKNGDTPSGLELVDVRSWSVRVVDRAARNVTFAADRLLVEDASGRRAFGLTAYGRDGGLVYRTRLDGATWMRKQGRLGYACRYVYLRSVLDLATGRAVRSAFPSGTRCPTLLVGDSRG